jgi:hypothetical protein
MHNAQDALLEKQHELSTVVSGTDPAMAGCILGCITQHCQALLPVLDFSKAFGSQVPSFQISFYKS